MKKSALAILLFLAFLLPQGHANAASPSQLLIVNTATNKMAFYQNGKLVKEFIVATGKSSSSTPKGKYSIVSKIKNRPYYTRNIPGGDPRNPLGDRWLGLNMGGTYGTTYAIHGNNNPSAIGKWTTLGCIRMYNNDVRWLYDRVNVKTTVIVTSSNTSYKAVAAKYGVLVM
jgi:lipoprotein-anchoring transpeptidase ErfK/SrfK